jgi:UDP-N-acetyl-D-mannosaminuronic acid dehydrogenase
VPVRLIPAARAVNDRMPLHMVELLEEALAEAGKTVAGTRVLVLGYAYLENADDTRNSPSAVLVDRLWALGAEVVIHDPYVAGYQGEVLAMAQGCDATVVMVAHEAYRALDLDALKAALRTPVLVDGRRVFAPPADWIYRGVGRGRVT